MKVVFFVAHPDDEAFGPAATIAKLATEFDVQVVCLCNGKRPGAEFEVSTKRQAAFRNTCKKLGARYTMHHFDDATLTLTDAMKVVEQEIATHLPDLVFTHNISDLHKDHRVLAEAVTVACRPKPSSSVKALLMFEQPASTEWTFGVVHPPFTPNVFVDITRFIELKKTVMGYYDTELYEFPDARSIKGMEVLALNRGRQSGLVYAEAFQLVFARDHIPL